MSGVDKLIKLLTKIDQQGPSRCRHRHRRMKSYEQLNGEVVGNIKSPWHENNVNGGRKVEVRPLKAKVLNNWQIARMMYSERSFAKNYKGVKIPAQRKTFIRFGSKDKDGHYPMLYEIDYAKMNRIRSNMSDEPFRKVNTVQTKLFGSGLTISRPSLSSRLSSNYTIDA